jgi:hypothetical protein
MPDLTTEVQWTVVMSSSKPKPGLALRRERDSICEMHQIAFTMLCMTAQLPSAVLHCNAVIEIVA